MFKKYKISIYIYVKKKISWGEKLKTASLASQKKERCSTPEIRRNT